MVRLLLSNVAVTSLLRDFVSASIGKRYKAHLTHLLMQKHHSNSIAAGLTAIQKSLLIALTLKVNANSGTKSAIAIGL